MSVKVDISKAKEFLSSEGLSALSAELERADSLLKSQSGPGNDFLGWIDLPENYDRAEFERILAAAEKIKADSRALVVIGIGGSYLGARAVIEYLKSPNYNLVAKDTPMILFAGNTLSPSQTLELANMVSGLDFSVNVISKSGTTTEPAVAFRIFRGLLEEKYGAEGAKSRIYATTDEKKGALKGLADSEGYESFVVPDDVGGRYSVLTAVGLLPIAVAGIDIKELMEGAAQARKELSHAGLSNPAWQYAACRSLLYREGRSVEILACYEPFFRYMGEWWKQLFGESEGKEHKGLFPAYCEFTTDLHSMGQFIQEGSRTMLETTVVFEQTGADIVIQKDESDGDGLNFLAGKELSFVNRQAFLGTFLAHASGGVPGIVITVADRCERSLGYLIYFFEYACALSGYVLDVNPFDQPGVEAYKKNMFALLGKPGFEKEGRRLRSLLR